MADTLDVVRNSGGGADASIRAGRGIMPGRPDAAVAVLFALALLLFIAVRLVYWGHVTEEPFSDMADYIHWGSSWAAGDWFMHGQFWGGAYKPPGVPLLYAAVFALTGGHDVASLRWVQLAISVAGVAFLAWQLVRATGTVFAGLLLILVVTFTKSSVFWSFKAGTEVLSEGLLYLCLGAALWAYRDSASRWKYIALAAATVFATFVRPNSLPLVGVLVLFPLLKEFRASGKSALQCALVYALAVACFWTPWIARNYAHCGQLVPLSTQGPYTFLWELGDVNLPGPNGQRMVVHVNKLQAEASKQFANDCQASQYAMGLVKVWVKENITTYPEMIGRRLLRYTTDRQIDLTHISRFKLHPDLDRVLFDKSQGQIAVATVTMVLLAFLFPWASIILAGVATTLVFSAFFLGDARMFEPFIPLFLFMTVAPAIPVWKWLMHRRRSMPMGTA
jgi:hypothetical protein